MKKHLLLVFAVSLGASGCSSVDGSSFIDSNAIFLNNETPATKLAYQAWLECGIRYVDSHVQPRRLSQAFNDPVANSAVEYCKPQEYRVMSQINLDDFHKNWMHRNYYKTMQNRHGSDQIKIEFS